MKKLLLLFAVALSLFLSSCSAGMSSFRQNDGFGYQPTQSIDGSMLEHQLN